MTKLLNSTWNTAQVTVSTFINQKQKYFNFFFKSNYILTDYELIYWINHVKSD